MSVVAVQVCLEWATNPDNSVSCTQLAWQQAFLIPPEASGYVDILVSGGFSPEAFGIGFVGVLTVFASGLGFGWIASLLRKAR